MQKTNLETLHSQYLLSAVLICIVLINLVANFIGEETASIVGNFAYIPIVGLLIFVSSTVLKKLGYDGMHGKAWISLLIATVLWFVAELTWLFYELILDENPFPSNADVFYSVGYVFMFAFMIFYIFPVRKGITKKSLLSSIVTSSIVLTFGLFPIIDTENSLGDLSTFYAILYPILDAVLIVPAILGISLFFSGKVNFMWTLVSFGILSLFVADNVFLYSQMDDSYYTGHPIEILFHFFYVLIAFGVYDQMRIFGSKNKTIKSS